MLGCWLLVPFVESGNAGGPASPDLYIQLSPAYTSLDHEIHDGLADFSVEIQTPSTPPPTQLFPSLSP